MPPTLDAGRGKHHARGCPGEAQKRARSTHAEGDRKRNPVYPFSSARAGIFHTWVTREPPASGLAGPTQPTPQPQTCLGIGGAAKTARSKDKEGGKKRKKNRLTNYIA